MDQDVIPLDELGKTPLALSACQGYGIELKITTDPL